MTTHDSWSHATLMGRPHADNVSVKQLVKSWANCNRDVQFVDISKQKRGINRTEHEGWMCTLISLGRKVRLFSLLLFRTKAIIAETTSSIRSCVTITSSSGFSLRSICIRSRRKQSHKRACTSTYNSACDIFFWKKSLPMRKESNLGLTLYSYRSHFRRPNASELFFWCN